ncbi:dienelactone hydrolase family protein [Ornithinicoccus hortensis]|uniref:Carboxymethylenebutenolidase n=1 Tax=Ornithinicoccus hortensis TaxID=82346 RepID=A0A542YNB1_9MICO|nr:dienelactone hydrolase family protein [Ornithinicoccus hortensis]TQL49595.1 carboxymethylenebutenolidase [Ornithinicoccus hortensis]
MSAPAAHTVATRDGELPAHLWLPAGDGPRPGLVVVQEIFGVSDYITARCADLADLGYAVLAPELYGRLEDAEVDESDPDFLQHAMAIAGRLDWDLAVQDTLAAAADLSARPEVGQVGLVGFCFGGGLAFQVAAQGDPAALVSYYGSALPQLTGMAAQVTCPQLHHFGTADTFIPMDQVEQVRSAVTADGTRPDVEFEVHDGAGHAFDNPHPMFHHAGASAAAWAQTTDFLARVLPTA